MKHREEALALGPDGYSRFYVIVQLLEQMYRKHKQPVKVLDIGGCSPYLQEVMEQSSLTFDLTILDILPKPRSVKVRYIQGDATRADLPDGSFDVVVSTDTLEHIPPQAKDAFVKACMRLCKDACILAAPFDTEGVHVAEEYVNDFNKQLFQVGQDWLEEHFEYGKPSVAQTSKVFDSLGTPYAHFGTNNLYSWLFSAHMNLIEAKLGMDTAATLMARKAYNSRIAASIEFSGPTYRHFFVVYKNKQLQLKDPVAAMTKPQDPRLFGEFMHGIFSALATSMTEQHHELHAARDAQERLAQQLHNEQTFGRKQAEEIERLRAELQRFEPLRRVARLRRPKHAISVVKRKLTGK